MTGHIAERLQRELLVQRVAEREGVREARRQAQRAALPSRSGSSRCDSSTPPPSSDSCTRKELEMEIGIDHKGRRGGEDIRREIEGRVSLYVCAIGSRSVDL